jgi:NAD(P)H-hydrate repair Nnr-like enzyme with NAD(P)H-hydrate dehydratase domain
MTDVVCLRGEGEAKAARMPADEDDILAPKQTVWQKTGGAGTVLTGLLALPDDYPAVAAMATAPAADRTAPPSRLVRVP